MWSDRARPFTSDSGLAAPGERWKFAAPIRLGIAYDPRLALPVGAASIFFAVFNDERYPRSTPLSTSVRVDVATPSPSNGALRSAPGVRASSTIVTRSLATAAPSFPPNRLFPLI